MRHPACAGSVRGWGAAADGQEVVMKKKAPRDEASRHRGDQTRADVGGGGEGARPAVERSLEREAELVLEVGDGGGVGQGDGAAAEAAAGHSGAEDAGDAHGGVDDEVEFWATDAEVVAEGGVGIEHALAEALEVGVAEGGDGELDAVLFGANVTGGAKFGVGEIACGGGELRWWEVGEVGEIEFGGGGLACGDAIGELGGGESVAHAGVDDQQRRFALAGHGNVLGGLAEGAVDAEGVVGGGGGGGELVHEATGHVGELVLGALAGEGGVERVPGRVGEGEEGAGEGDFEGGGTGESAAEGDVGGDGEVEGGERRGEEWAEVEEDAQDIGGPVVRGGEGAEGVGGGGAEGFEREGEGVDGRGGDLCRVG